MNIQRLAAACAVALLIAAIPGCEDVPLIPRWDAEFYVPLKSQRIQLLGPFPAAIPPGTSANVSFPEQKQALDDAVGELLDQDLSAARAILTVTTTVPLNGSDTAFVAASTAALTNAGAVRMVLPITLLAANATTVDTVTVTAQGLAMLKSVAQNNDTLHIQLRGLVTYPGPGVRNITANDTIGVRIALLARIAVSH